MSAARNIKTANGELIMKFKKLEEKLNEYGFVDAFNDYAKYINESNFTDEQRKQHEKKLSKYFKRLIAVLKSDKLKPKSLSKITVVTKFELEKRVVNEKSRLKEKWYINNIMFMKPEDVFPLNDEQTKEAA